MYDNLQSEDVRWWDVVYMSGSGSLNITDISRQPGGYPTKPKTTNH